MTEALELTKWYSREHVVLCLLPAFWIAGAIAAFVSQASVMRYLGPAAPKPLAYGVGSVSGTILAVCSCTVLPLFSGIYRMGAGLGPATAFLYSGPAINVLAIVMTAKILGAQLGVARAVGAVAFSLVIGVAMALLFRREERQKAATAVTLPVPGVGRPLRQTAAFFAVLVGILVFANWGAAAQKTGFSAVTFARASDEHGRLELERATEGLDVGDKIRLTPGHCDPTLNLYDWYVGVRRQRVECIWPVAARGALT